MLRDIIDIEHRGLDPLIHQLFYEVLKDGFALFKVSGDIILHELTFLIHKLRVFLINGHTLFIDLIGTRKGADNSDIHLIFRPQFVIIRNGSLVHFQRSRLGLVSFLKRFHDLITVLICMVILCFILGFLGMRFVCAFILPGLFLVFFHGRKSLS